MVNDYPKTIKYRTRFATSSFSHKISLNHSVFPWRITASSLCITSQFLKPRFLAQNPTLSQLNGNTVNALTYTILTPLAIIVQSTNGYVNYGVLGLFRDYAGEKIKRTVENKSGRFLPRAIIPSFGLLLFIELAEKLIDALTLFLLFSEIFLLHYEIN